MKICPSCDEPYDDEPVFCELDGTPLVVVVAGRQAEKGEGQSAPGPRSLAPQQEAQRERNSITLFMGIALGVLVSAAAFAFFRLVQHEDKAAKVHEPLKAGVAPAVAPPPRPRSIPDEPSPAPVDSPTPVEAPTPPADAPASTTAPPPPLRQEDGLETLSDSPASIGSPSGGRGERQLAIHLNNGTTFLADDAWRAPGGVWYRQGGVVSLLEHSRISSVERLPVPKSSPASQ